MLTNFVDFIIYSLFHINDSSQIGHVLHFFIYDTIKIFFILFSVIFVIGVIRTYIPQNKLRTWLNSKNGLGNFFASLLGAITPFCSCSGIPIFLSFVRLGVPLGVTFSFLITSPLVNEYLVVLMVGFFGWKIAVLYVISGILLGVVLGLILGRMKLEKYIEESLSTDSFHNEDDPKYETFSSRLKFALEEVVWIIKKLWKWIFLGVFVGALIHNYVPRELVESLITKTGVFSVPIAVTLGVPMYGSCAAIVPIAVALFRKGVPLGVALAFMMATAGLSLPEAVILRRAMKMKLLIIFFTITALGIIVTGYLFNFLEKIL